MSKVFEEAPFDRLPGPDGRRAFGSLKQWMRQDKLGFFMAATEKREISVVEIKEILNRFCRSTGEAEQSLSGRRPPSPDRPHPPLLSERLLTC